MNVYINLTFGTAEGRLFTMRVPRAVSSASSSLVRNAMDALINANCIKTSGGDLVARERASIVKVTSETIDVA